MELAIVFVVGVVVGMGAYHQWLKRSPETLRKMLDAVKKGGGSGDGP